MQRTPPIRHNGYDRANPNTKVVLACTAEWVNEQEVRVTATGIDLGRDWLAFTCPRCGREHESFRYA